MRKLTLVLCALSIGTSFAQKLDSVVGTYSQPTKDLIEKNWGEYFKESISEPIFRKNAKNTFPLRFDSYGLVYPENNLFEHISLDMMKANGQNGTKLTKYSFFHIFEWYSSSLKNSIYKMRGEDSTFYTGLIHKVKVDRICVAEFNMLWENYHTPKALDRFCEKAKSYSRVVIFIHGYNVPYSLAALQFDFVINKFGLNDGKTLFVPVYWPSNADKHCNIKENGVNFKDRISVTNGWKFLYYSNQAYFAGLSLRQFIARIEPGKTVKMISHSLGATVATTAFIDPGNKLQGGETGPVNIEIAEKMRRIHVPRRPVDVFLSAPAIPGELTFKNLGAADCPHYRVSSAWNKNDKVLNKRFLGISLGAHRLSETELGLNYRKDAENAKLVADVKCKGNFEHRQVSSQKSHDIFSYLEQPGYCDFLKEFFNR